MAEIEGEAAPDFEAVRDAFAANFAEGAEVGAAVSVIEKINLRREWCAVASGCGALASDATGDDVDRSQATMASGQRGRVHSRGPGGGCAVIQAGSARGIPARDHGEGTLVGELTHDVQRGAQVAGAPKITDTGAMSRYFQVGDQVLWNPSNGVAELFASTAEALVSTAGAPTGIGPVEADEYEIDLDIFGAFVDALVRRYVASRHPILRCLLEGFTATALVMVQRGGRGVAVLGEPASADLRDVSVGPAGMAAPGDAGRLRDLMEKHARAMPY